MGHVYYFNLYGAKVVRFSFLYIMSAKDYKKDIFIVGLTGGIGSGKTTVARVFQALGVPRFDADKAAHQIYLNNASIRNAIIDRFGEVVAVRNQEGETVDLNRKELGKLAFNEAGGIEFLNKLVHPAVKEAFEVWLMALPRTTPYVLRESAILFESGSDKGCDAVLTISTDEGERINRVLKRDGVGDQSARQIIMGKFNAQLSEQKRLELSDYVINNNDKDRILPQVEKLHALWSKTT
jgi:dephospho-CoA kinase